MSLKELGQREIKITKQLNMVPAEYHMKDGGRGGQKKVCIINYFRIWDDIVT